MSNQQFLEQEDLEALNFLETRIKLLQQEQEEIIFQAQGRALAKFTELQDKTVVIIGGKGGLGSIFWQIFSQTARVKQCLVLDVDNQDQAPQILPLADLVIFSVPIHSTKELIKHYCQWIRPDAGICDLTSIKEEPIEAMLAYHSGPVQGYHPMFGIDTPSLNNQLIISCPGRNPEYFKAYEQLWQILGAKITELSSEKHDQIMCHIQAVRHFHTFIQGSFTASQQFTLEELSQACSPIYNLELIMIGRLFAQNPELYADIIYDNKLISQNLDRYLDIIITAKKAIDNKDKQSFIEQFNKTKGFYGQKADLYLEQSAKLLHTSTRLKVLSDNNF